MKEPKRIKIDPQTLIVSRTDINGYIEYVNNDFCKISGYKADELIQRPHSIIRHPDMPAVIFKWMWERLRHNEDLFAVVKNRTKTGDYYWVTTRFEIRTHPYNKGVVTGYVAHRKGAGNRMIDAIEPLYDQLLKIEREEGIVASEAFLKSFLYDKSMSYDQYIEHLSTDYHNPIKSLFKRFLSA